MLHKRAIDIQTTNLSGSYVFIFHAASLPLLLLFFHSLSLRRNFPSTNWRRNAKAHLTNGINSENIFTVRMIIITYPIARGGYAGVIVVETESHCSAANLNNFALQCRRYIYAAHEYRVVR